MGEPQEESNTGLLLKSAKTNLVPLQIIQFVIKMYENCVSQGLGKRMIIFLRAVILNDPEFFHR